jgi:hypothetical protein
MKKDLTFIFPGSKKLYIFLENATKVRTSTLYSSSKGINIWTESTNQNQYSNSFNGKISWMKPVTRSPSQY